MKFVAIATFVAGMAGLTANAATFDFKAASTGKWEDSITYPKINDLGQIDNANGIGLTVSGSVVPGTASKSGKVKVQTWQGYGLGVKSTEDCDSKGWSPCQGDDHQVDSSGPDDIAVFLFTEAVKIVSITFNYVDANDTFDFYVDGAEVESALKVKNEVMMSSLVYETLFGVGAGQTATSYCYKSGYGNKAKEICKEKLVTSAFKITSITVEKQMPPVPLPASALLLVGALGGLGLWRRVSRKAA